MAVIIVGGGIGGLATALSLHQIGVPCKIFESVTKVAPLGVGINLLPHAVRELTELGLRPKLARDAVATAELAYYSKHGQLIWSEPRGEAAGYDWPQFSIHRGELQMLLYDEVLARLGPESVYSGHHLLSWEQDGEGVRASFGERDSSAVHHVCEAEALIGADGIHSQVRASLYPDEPPPIWNGAVLWRGVTRALPFLTGRSMIMAGHEFQKFVCYPITGSDHNALARINWVAERKFPVAEGWRREDWNRTGDLADFLPQFEKWNFDWLDVPSLIRGADHIYEYPMVDRDPLSRWSYGRVTLLGDAAHPMYPIGSNGASQAIVDARHLTRAIQRLGIGPEAFQAYEAERRPATEKIVLANRGNGPEQVMQLVEERAPDGFDRINTVLTDSELHDVAATYKRIAGFDRDELNKRRSIVSV
ncbi:MAG: flavin-dependent oxidoreductase [Gammaproteobacteria bacterium]|nr:flavin-dependent oxidoreductase [Gammaproteobacteria bacterium]